MATDETPSRNEQEYFARENAELVKALRAQLDAARAGAGAESSTMQCPRCGGRLDEREHRHVKVDVCSDCGGTWLDKGELELLSQVEQGGARDFFGGLFGIRNR